MWNGWYYYFMEGMPFLLYGLYIVEIYGQMIWKRYNDVIIRVELTPGVGVITQFSVEFNDFWSERNSCVLSRFMLSGMFEQRFLAAVIRFYVNL